MCLLGRDSKRSKTRCEGTGKVTIRTAGTTGALGLFSLRVLPEIRVTAYAIGCYVGVIVREQ